MFSEDLHRFKRMPYGLHSASEVFQGTILKIICSIENVGNSQDDVIVWGKDLHFHNESLKMIFEKIRSQGLKLNKSKRQIAVNELVSLGHIISSDGIKAGPKKAVAIINLPQPANKAKFF